MQEFIDKLIGRLEEESFLCNCWGETGECVVPIEKVDEIAKELAEQHNNGWIPCSERLPEEGEDVLVWFEYFRYGEYNGLYQTTGIGYVWKGDWSGFVNGSSGWHQLRIIAWQPLPPAYKEGGV